MGGEWAAGKYKLNKNYKTVMRGAGLVHTIFL